MGARYFGCRAHRTALILTLRHRIFKLPREYLPPLELCSLIGYSAALITTIAFVPQARKSWHMRDLSGAFRCRELHL